MGATAHRKERAGSGKYLGFACPVVAAQKQVPVAEPEFLAVVVKELDQAETKGLPTFTQWFRQCGRDGESGIRTSVIVE